MVAVSTVANPSQPTKGIPAREAVRSTGLAALTNATLLATIVAATTVLTARSWRLKNNRLQPPIMNTFKPRSASALDRWALGAARSRR